MKLSFMPEAWEDYLYWQRTDPKMLGRINELLRDTVRSPFRGIGKPELLRETWSGWWSRRIDTEHRFVYRIVGKGDDQLLEIAQCRFHYER